MYETLGAVAIGRNEGDRLKRCLKSLQRGFQRIVYVDSGSSDGSVQFARSMRVSVVELDMSIPFSMGRARNAGFKVLMDNWPDTEFVQIIDGDCEIIDAWCYKGVEFLISRQDVALVTGWRRERFRNANIYNMMCDLDWEQPAGEIKACGGDYIIRAPVFQQIGGYNPNIIASEDHELCIRVRNAGWKIYRLEVDMTLHDAAMTTFLEWWRRSVRTGHGFAQVGHLYSDYFVPERRRTWFWGAILPGAALVFAPLTDGMSLALLMLFFVSFVRTRINLMKSGINRAESGKYAKFLTISKFPNLIGMLKYWYRYVLRRKITIIEYQ